MRIKHHQPHRQLQTDRDAARREHLLQVRVRVRGRVRVRVRVRVRGRVRVRVSPP